MTLNRHINILLGILIITFIIFVSLIFKEIIPLYHEKRNIIATACLVFDIIIAFVDVFILCSVCMVLSDNGNIYFLNFRKCKLENFILFPGNESENGVFKQKLYSFSLPNIFEYRYERGYDILIVENKRVYEDIKRSRSDIICRKICIVVYHDDSQELVWNSSIISSNYFKTTSKEVYSKFKLRV